jgi:ribose/xylose/arabinose/galactoside ABC-type transport system permease subunit
VGTVPMHAGSAAVTRKAIFRQAFESPIAGPVITLAGVFILFSLFVPRFFQFDAIAGIVNAATLTGIITIGVTTLMIAGEFDLSVGPMMAWGAYLFGSLIQRGTSPILALVLGLLVPSLLGAVNGAIFNRTRIPSFIVTLGTQFIYRGALWVYSGGNMVQTTAKTLPIYTFFNGRLEGLVQLIPGANFRSSLFWLIGLVILFQFILVRTQFGNHVLSTGGNPGAAAAQGVNVKKIKLMCFMLSGLLSGLAGVLLFSQYGTARIATGAGEELSAIAAAVVGGTLLTGGSGSIVGGLLGIMTISMLRTGVVRLNLPFIPADNFPAVIGVTIVAAAIFNNYIRRRA